MNYPIAQLFTSPQGEGQWTGALMRFVRLAGCNVGKYTPVEKLSGEFKLLREQHPQHSLCTTALGQTFLCDTNYHLLKQMTAEEAMAECPPSVTRMCITGGEPFLHNLSELVEYALDADIAVHIETSGTLPIPQHIGEKCWITCSPKQGIIAQVKQHVNEYKFVIGAEQEPDEVLAAIYKVIGGRDEPTYTPVYVQPINGIDLIDRASVKTTLAVLNLDPRLFMSIQMHKAIGVE